MNLAMRSEEEPQPPAHPVNKLVAQLQSVGIVCGLFATAATMAIPFIPH